MAARNTAKCSQYHEMEWDKAWTHQLWSTGHRRQIDFVLVDEVRKEDSAGYNIISELDGKSDHRTLAADFCIGKWKPQRTRRVRIQKGWKAHVDEYGKPSAYHETLDLAPTSFQNADVDLADLVVKAATGTGGSSASSKSAHSEYVQGLFGSRRNELEPERRKGLSKQLWKALRKQRRQREQVAYEALVHAGAGLKKLQHTQARRTGVRRINRMRDREGAKAVGSELDLRGVCMLLRGPLWRTGPSGPARNHQHFDGGQNHSAGGGQGLDQNEKT